MQPLIHQYSIQVSRNLFWSPKYGFIVSRGSIGIRDAARLGFEPMLVYGISVEYSARLRVSSLTKARQYARRSAPLDPMQVLLRMWQQFPNAGGCPDLVKISPKMADAIPEMKEIIEALGVKCEAKRDRSYSMNLRWHHDMEPDFWDYRDEGDQGKGVRWDLDALNLLARASWDRFSWEPTPWLDGRDRKEPPESIGVIERPIDWEAEWLEIGQANIIEVASCELAFEPTPSMPVPVVDARSSDDDFDSENDAELVHYARDALGRLAKAWPVSWVGVLPPGLSAADLRAYASGRRNIAPSDVFRLASTLRVRCEMDDEETEWMFFPTGSYVLKPTGPRTAVELYDLFTLAGELPISAELMPTDMPADSTWRYLLLRGWRDEPSVLMFPRESTAALVLDKGKEKLDYFEGVRVVSDDLYSAIVRLCAAVCNQSGDPRELCESTWRKHREEIEALERELY